MFLTLYLYDSDGCHVDYLYDNQQLTAAMWVICMTTNSNGCHMDCLKKEVLYHFSLLKVISQKTKVNIESKTKRGQLYRVTSHKSV